MCHEYDMASCSTECSNHCCSLSVWLAELRFAVGNSCVIQIAFDACGGEIRLVGVAFTEHVSCWDFVWLC